MSEVDQVARRPLRRSARHKLIAGVCGGIAEWRGWKPGLVRAAFVVGSLLPILPGLLLYIVLWLLLPPAGETSS
jgi:phage shock protein C